VEWKNMKLSESLKHYFKYLLAAMVSITLSSATLAQLSSPIAGSVPAGKGAGVHSPNSPFKPLAERADVLSWNLLTDVKTKNIKGNIVPVFNAAQMALNQRSQRVQGFMMPLDPGEKQTHFLLSSVPLNCGFCTPGGPESMIEVRTKTGVKYSMEPVVVEGNFQVLVNDSFGVYYKIVDATPVK
jgi:uncharacterized protein